MDCALFDIKNMMLYKIKTKNNQSQCLTKVILNTSVSHILESDFFYFGTIFKVYIIFVVCVLYSLFSLNVKTFLGQLRIHS